MADIGRLAREHTELTATQIDHLRTLVAEWGLIADLGFADLVLWLPTWNGGGFVAGAHQRPDTGRTLFARDIVGRFEPRGRRPLVDRAWASAAPHSGTVDGMLQQTYPVTLAGVPVAVLGRYSTRVVSSDAGQLEAAYLASADDLCAMVQAGTFPVPGRQADGLMRVGGGLVRLNDRGVVTFASPNAVSAFRRLGAAVDIEGSDLGRLVPRLHDHVQGGDPDLARVAGGLVAGRAEVAHADTTLALASLPLVGSGRRLGALVLVRDISEVRSRERALLSKEATLREVHHRVKNNLQMVAALLRMQSRRVDSEEARSALAEAGHRIGAIALVHEALARSPEEGVEFDDVCDRVLAMARDLAPNARLAREGRAGVLSADVASPLAMCLAEVVANAVEHGGQGVRVTLRIRREDAWVTLVVDDDGPGLPSGFDPESGGRLGLQIVQTLMREGGGQVTWGVRRGGGTEVEMSFPLQRKELGL